MKNDTFLLGHLNNAMNTVYVLYPQRPVTGNRYTVSALKLTSVYNQGEYESIAVLTQKMFVKTRVTYDKPKSLD